MLLTKRAIPFTDVNVTADQAVLTEMWERSGNRTVPQIFIGDYHVGGSDQLYALHRQNKLDALLFPQSVDA